MYYVYDKSYKMKVAQMIKNYPENYGTGIYEFYNLTLANYTLHIKTNQLDIILKH